MIKLPQPHARTLIAVHGWSGVLLGMLLYVVICTGVAAVFAEEIGDWSSPLAHQASPVRFPPGIDRIVRELSTKVDPKYYELIAVDRSAGGRINIFFHRDAVKPDGEKSEEGTEFELDPSTWTVLATRTGWQDEIEGATRASGIADFLINLHIRLHIPNPYGYLVTGIVGLAMMIAAVTAFLIHRHLFSEMFTLRLGRDALLRRRDLHVVAGSWNLPFAFLVALTGSFFSLAASIGLPAIALVNFGGNQEALTDTLYGTARANDARPATLANIETLLSQTRKRQHAEPDYISVAHYGRADATVTVSNELPANTLVYSSDLYDGASGSLIRVQPPLGKSPSPGASLVGLMYPLHFGNFSGIASKILWAALGSGAAYVTLTGILLWTRRRQEFLVCRGLERFVYIVGFGLPLVLCCAPYAFFLLRSSDIEAGTAQDLTFVIAGAVICLLSFAVSELSRLRRYLLSATGVALIGLPAVRFATGGMGWRESSHFGISAVSAIDISLVVCGLACVLTARRKLT